MKTSEKALFANIYGNPGRAETRNLGFGTIFVRWQGAIDYLKNLEIRFDQLSFHLSQ